MKLLDPDSKLYQILSTAASFIALNLLWLLCSAPLLTAGVSTAAMYSITRKMARHEDPAGMEGNALLRVLIWLAAGIIGVFSSYLWPLLAWYDNTLGNTLRNAVLLPLSNLFIALTVTVLNLLPLFLLLRHTAFFLRISFLWLVAGFALTAFVNTQLLRLQFRHVTGEDGL